MISYRVLGACRIAAKQAAGRALSYCGMTNHMSVKKVAISLSEEALRAVDRYAKHEGISRSAWFERAARRAQRQEAARSALREMADDGMKASTEAALEALRQELQAG